MKENEKIDKYFNLARELKPVKYTGVSYTN